MIKEIPSFKAEKSESITKETQRKGIWEKIKGSVEWKKLKDLSKIAAFVLLANVIGMEVVKAQEKVDFDTQIEKLREDAQKNFFVLFENVKEKAQREGFLGGTPTKEWITPDGSSVHVGYETSAREKASWIILQNEDASRVFYDAGANGDINRVIINKHTYSSGLSEKKMDNYMYAFPTDMDGMAYRAKIIASLDSRDITVFDFDSQKKKVKVIDFSDGTYTGVEGVDSEEWIVKSQQKFNNTLANIK